MKIKKLVSAVSAFAMTVSAFAGMTVAKAADEEVVFERGYSTAWSETDSEEWTSANSTITAKSETGLAVSGGNASWSAKKTLNVTDNSIITFDAVWNTGDANGNGGQYTYLDFGDAISFRAYTQDQKGVVKVGDSEYLISNACSKSNGNRVSDTWTINVVVDTALDCVSKISVTGTNGTKKAGYSYEAETGDNGLSIAGADYTTVSTGFVKTKTAGSKSVVISKISVKEEKQSVETANYKINYTDIEGNKIKESATRTGVVDSTVALIDEDTADFKTNEKKYIYVSDNSETTTIDSDGTSECTVVFREAETYTYIVKNNLGDTIQTNSDFEGESFNVPYSQYCYKDGVLWKTNAVSSQYKKTYTLTEDNQTETIDYIETKIGDVIYFSEGENITGLTRTEKGNIAIRSSNCAAAYAESDTIITTLPSGKYQIYGVVFSGSSAGATLKFSAGENTFDFVVASSSNWTECHSDEIEVLEPVELKFLTSGKDNAAIDYLYVVKTGEYTPATATYSFVNDYTTETGETAADNASLFKLVVKAGTNAISSLNVKVNGTSAETAPEITTISGETEAVFAVVVNALSSSVESITAVINGDDVAATAAE